MEWSTIERGEVVLGELMTERGGAEENEAEGGGAGKVDNGAKQKSRRGGGGNAVWPS